LKKSFYPLGEYKVVLGMFKNMTSVRDVACMSKIFRLFERLCKLVKMKTIEDNLHIYRKELLGACNTNNIER